MSTCKVEFKGFNIDSGSLDNYLNQFTIDGKQKINGAKNTISYLLSNAEDNKLGVLKLALNSNKAYIKDLANMMLNTNRKFYAEVEINNNLKGFSKYNANDNKIYINVDAISQRFSESAEEYLYERIVHDFIQGFSNKELKKAYSDANRDSPHMRNIINLFKEYQNITDKKQYDLFKGSIEKEPLLDPRSERSLIREGFAEGTYRAITNPAEFLSYGLSSTQFRNTLRKQNLWQKFVSWLKDLLGISQDNNDLEYLYKNLDGYLKTEEEKQQTGSQSGTNVNTNSQENSTEEYGEEFQVDQFIFSYNPETGKYYQHFKSKKGEVKELTNEKQQNKTFLKYIEKHPEHAEVVTYENTGNKYVYDKQRDKVISLSTADTIVQPDIIDKIKNHEEYEHKKEVERIKRIIKSNISSLNDIDMLELFHELRNKGYDIKDEVVYFEALLEIREDEKKEIHKKEEPIKKEEIAKEEKPKEESKSFNEHEFSYKGITIPTRFQLSEEQEQALITLIENITSGDTEPITLSGYAGCLAYGTKILMFDGSYKEVQDVVVGDKLMGIDSTPRTVLELKRGREQMYWIHQNKGMSYRVNESHILSTKHHKKGLVNQTVLEYLSRKTSAKDYKGYKANLIEFPEKELKIDPYFLGLWLGDGTTSEFPNITNNDIEIEQYLKENFVIKGVWKKDDNKTCKTYNLYKEGISEEFKKYFEITNKSHLESKFIPKDFLINSSENRKKLLAGLIDTDGYLDIKRKEYEIVTKHEQLAKDITFLIRSLGFYVNCRVKYATCTNCKEEYYKVWRITFSVDKDLPILIERRKVQELSNFKNRLHTGLRVEKDAVDDYYGFTLDGDNLFILEDFTVTHNTGKTSVIGYLEDYLKKKRGYKFLYGAPTHAATLYLGYNTKKMPFTIASSVVKRIDDFGNVTYTTSSKVDKALSDYDQNIFVVDEVSLIDSTTMDNFLSVMDKKGVKVIFMGDKMQLPEVASKGKINPETKNPIKDVSKAFTDFKLIQLSQVQRTKDNAILRVLTEIRNNPDGVLPVVDNTETLQFFDKDGNTKGFYSSFRRAYEVDPEETVYITYTNEDVKNFNKSFRKAFYGEDVDGLVEGESVIGYSGYNNKKIKSNDLANSIKYTVENVSYDGSEVKITLKSNAVQKLADLHTPNKENDKTVQTTYLQMSRTDSLDMKNLTDEDFLKNNIRLSETFRDVYDFKKRALETNRWGDFSETLAKMTGGLAKLEIGDDYFYNPYTNMMEKESSVNWSKPEMANLKRNYKELFMSKSIDYGYGITIHKAQGATYKNVFFNATSTEFAKTEIHENGMKISTEGNSLNYVAMSRASEKLFVLHSNNIKRLNNDNSIELSKNCSIF